MNSEFLMLPHFDPTIFTFGNSNIGLRWYGLMYLLGFIFARWLAVRRANQPNSGWTVDQVDTLLFNGFMGVFLGGRIGDVFFYNFDHFVQDPLYLFRVWEGGMSFHGGLGMGRIGNFINLELWGRETEVPWAMIFPNDPLLLPRHPSQLYEAFLEGFVLFIILNVFIKKPRPVGSVAGLFLVGYGIFRFIVEYVREPEVESFLGIMTRGQALCLPMIIGGGLIMAWAYNRSKSAVH